MKEVKSVRVDTELLQKAQKLGFNLTAIVTEALEKIVKEKKCPTCGKKV